jgi:deoxyhypusine synthase
MPSSLAVRGVDFQGVTVNEHKPQEESKERNLHDPVSDKLVPLAPLDLAQIKSVDDLVRAMGNTSFTARQVGEGADVLETMARDRGCFVVMTLAGAMTVAKQGLIVTDLIDAGVVQAVISTGALMAHGLVEAAGRSHFRYDPRMDDTELYDAGYNRVYDTLEPETNLDFVETIVARILKGWDHNEPLCSYKLNRDIGKYLSENVKERGILKSAYEKGVPVFVPAFSDSEIGLDFALHNRGRRKNDIPALRYDPFEDLEFYAETLLQQDRLGIFTIGGGVPRNWAQQFGPYIDLRRRRGGEKLILKRFHYGVRICPEPVNWGGLSGCTYSEAVSWGKFVPVEEGGRFAEVLLDATVGLPLIAGAVLERIKR